MYSAATDTASAIAASTVRRIRLACMAGKLQNRGTKTKGCREDTPFSNRLEPAGRRHAVRLSTKRVEEGSATEFRAQDGSPARWAGKPTSGLAAQGRASSGASRWPGGPLRA